MEYSDDAACVAIVPTVVVQPVDESESVEQVGLDLVMTPAAEIALM